MPRLVSTMRLPGFRPMQSNLIAGAEIFIILCEMNLENKPVSSVVMLINKLNYDSFFFD